MAIFVFRMKTFSRSAGPRGSRATSAAAYRAGERIRDLRTGAVYDHRGRQDVLHREIVLPAALERRGAAMGWARDRSTLWNAAEHAETRRNARVAREFMVALPHELAASERIALARGLAQQLVERYHNAVDLVVHAPRGDPRNFHAHLLSTTRELTPEGLGRKTTLELSGTQRHRQGLLRWGQERLWLRERWASLANEALQRAHLSMRISHEYPATQDALRMPRLPSLAYHIEQRGGHSHLAERMRERHRSARLQQQPQRLESRARDGASPADHQLQRARWWQSVRAQAHSAWDALRQRGSSTPAIEREPAAAHARAIPALRGAPARDLDYFERAQSESLQRWHEYRRQQQLQPQPPGQARESDRQRERVQGMELDPDPGL